MNTVCSAFAHKKRNTATPPECFNVNRHIDWILSGIALISNFLCSNAFQFSNYAIFIHDMNVFAVATQHNSFHWSQFLISLFLGNSKKLKKSHSPHSHLYWIYWFSLEIFQFIIIIQRTSGLITYYMFRIYNIYIQCWNDHLIDFQLFVWNRFYFGMISKMHGLLSQERRTFQKIMQIVSRTTYFENFFVPKIPRKFV